MKRKVPSGPFAAIVMERIAQLKNESGITDPVAATARSTHTTPRLLYRLIKGEQTEIFFDTADKIVTHILGPMAWYTEPELHEIYAPEEYPAPERVPDHGSRNEYTTHHCRCAPCTEANRQYIRAYKMRMSLEAS